MKTSKIDAHTFGGNKAAEILVALLAEEGNKKYVHQVSRLFHKHTRVLNVIGGIDDDHVRKTLRNLWREKTREVVDESKLPTKIKSYLQNVLAVHFRKEFPAS